MIDPTDASALLRANASWTKSLDESLDDVATDFASSLVRVDDRLDEAIAATVAATKASDEQLDSSVQDALLAATDVRAALEGARGFPATYSALEVTSTARDRINAGWRELADSSLRVETGDLAGARSRIQLAHGKLVAARVPIERARHYADPVIAKDPRMGYFDDAGRRLDVGSRPPELANPAPVLDDAGHAGDDAGHVGDDARPVASPDVEELFPVLRSVPSSVERLDAPQLVQAHSRLTVAGQRMSLGSSFRVHAIIHGVDGRDQAMPIAREIHAQLGGTVGLRGIGIGKWQVGVLDSAPRLDPAQRAKLAETRPDRVELAGMDAVFLPHGPEYTARF